MKIMYTFSFLLIFSPLSPREAGAQQRYLITPENDAISIARDQSALQVVKDNSRQRQTAAICDPIFGYRAGDNPPEIAFQGFHKDVVGMWFVAPASGTIDSLYWSAGATTSNDSTIFIKIHSVVNMPNSYSSCQNWGYYPSTLDSCAGITPYPDEAMGSWTPLAGSQFLGTRLWGGVNGFQTTHHTGRTNSIGITPSGSFTVSKGDTFFVSMRVRGTTISPHVSDVGYLSWIIGSLGPTPSRVWKFYQHPVASCTPTPEKGWKARYASVDGVFNWWLSMTRTDDPPPTIGPTASIPYTSATSSQPFSVKITDCNFANPGQAAVAAADIIFKVNDGAPAAAPLTDIGDDVFQGSIPGQTGGSFVTYQVSATDDNDNTSLSPRKGYVVVGLENSAYDLDSNAAVAFPNIAATGTRISNTAWFNTLQPTPEDDGTAGPINMGSNFTLFGNSTLRYLWIGVNGAVSLTSSPADTQEINTGGFFIESLRIPGSTAITTLLQRPKNFVAPYYNDIVVSPTGTGSVYYKIDGAKFIIEYDSLKSYANPGDVLIRFAIIFDNTDKSVSFAYKNVGIGGLDTTALIGMQSDTVSGKWFSLLDYGDPAQLRPANNKAFRFTVHGTPSGIVSGKKFHDIDANGIMDGADSGLVNWHIRVKDRDGAVVSDAYTDASGDYTLYGIPYGDYVVDEEQKPGWVQTGPPGGEYHLSFELGHNSFAGMNFANTRAYEWTGSSSGSWSDGANWSDGHPPGPGDAADIPSGITVSVGSLPNDSIRALHLRTGSIINFIGSPGELKIWGPARFDSGSTVTFPSSGTSGLICYDDLISKGNFDPGHSSIKMRGNKKKVIQSEKVHTTAGIVFYNLAIEGDSTDLIGNSKILNVLKLDNPHTPRPKDTVFIDNSAPTAVQGTGTIPRGTVKRTVAQGETNEYRFATEKTFLKFNGGGTYPSAVAVTTEPKSAPRSFSLDWEVVGGVRDIVNHVIKKDSVKQFSKWAFGRPKITGSDVGTAEVDRLYTVSTDGGTGYLAEISLPYDPAEVQAGTPESSLELLRGPLWTDTVETGWNMISLPGIAEDPSVSLLYPTATAGPFAYAGTYQQRQFMTFGEGYWMKYSAKDPIAIVAQDYDQWTIPVRQGWNMIGAISYPASISEMAPQPPTTISSNVYGYSSSSGYSAVQMLLPGRAYWLKTTSAGSIVLSAESTPPGSQPTDQRGEGRTRDSEPSEIAPLVMNTITVSDAAHMERSLSFTSHRDGIDLGKYELPPIPPSGIPDVRFSTNLSVENGESGKDIPIVISSMTYPLRITWNVTEKECSSLLIMNGRRIPLRGEGFALLESEAASVALRVESTSEKPVPTEFALDQNYPNPFNPVTTIRYQLPVPSRVTLKIYDVLGQEVITLVARIEGEGYRAVDWDASAVGSGIYFYRLTSIPVTDPTYTFTESRKMLLLK